MSAKRLPKAFSAAVEDFLSRPARDSRRQIEVQRWCVKQLARNGVGGAQVEVALPGAYREKNWDVAKLQGGEPQLAISCKSIVKNVPGTVPNRLDDMLGEAVNLHRAYPRCVIGYLLLLSERDARDGKLMDHWFERCGSRLELCYPRASARAAHEQWEAVCLLQMPLTEQPRRYTAFPGCDGLDGFFSRLAEVYRERF